MNQRLFARPACRLLLVAFTLAAGVAGAGAADWPWWRGENRDGIAPAGQNPPVEFGPGKNERWSAPVPGRGHGSATVVGKRVFLAFADPEAQQEGVLCFDRQTGKELWKTVVHQGGLPEKMNSKASHASSTPACDGERVYINFLNGGSAFTTALTVEGEMVWQRELCKYTIHQGYGSSPAIYRDLVIVSADNKAGGVICAFHRADGKPAWRVERPKFPNYASPIIHRVGGTDQLFMHGCELVSCFDPLTGEKRWEFPGSTTECVTSIVTDGERIFISGGYPKNHVAAVAADGSGKVVWENNSRVYVPSMLVKDGYLYAIKDNGVAACWKSATGEPMWEERLARGVSGSPVLAGDRIYTVDETGWAYVHAADPNEFKPIAKNELGDESLSTPTIVDGAIYIRVATNEGGKRQERLYCFGE